MAIPSYAAARLGQREVAGMTGKFRLARIEGRRHKSRAKPSLKANDGYRGSAANRQREVSGGRRARAAAAFVQDDAPSAQEQFPAEIQRPVLLFP
jgi:hypothetical protein